MQVSADALKDFEWEKIAGLRLRAETIAEGLYLGAHRSNRRGTGVEFSGHRNYVAGDDLRWLDRHALMRHARLLIREFETETDRSLRLVLDATTSMGYAGDGAATSKLGFATLMAAVLARLAISAGDPVAVDWLGGAHTRWLPPLSGRQAFERVVNVLATVQASGDLYQDRQALDRAMLPVAKYARRGTSIVVFSDLAELPQEIVSRAAALCSRDRRVRVVRVLDPTEVTFPFKGSVRLRAQEGTHEVVTDAVAARGQYLAALQAETEHFANLLAQRGGRLLTLRTDMRDVEAVRQIVMSFGGVGQ